MDAGNAVKLLSAAAASLGGMQALAARLDIGERAMREYLEGNQPIPDALLLRVIDVLQERASKH